MYKKTSDTLSSHSGNFIRSGCKPGRIHTLAINAIADEREKTTECTVTSIDQHRKARVSCFRFSF